MTEDWSYRLQCPVQNYNWGNRDGLIQEFLGESGANNAGQPAAELWMGAHDSAPSRLESDGSTLNRAIEKNPVHFLGPDLAAKTRKLPFLFKILDASRPLSIQAHPDKKNAERLHTKDPEHYPDDNHKPELAVSLGGMKALIGFRPVEEIQNFFRLIPELSAICTDRSNTAPTGPDDESRNREWIAGRYGAMMRSSAEKTAQLSSAILKKQLDDPAIALYRKLTDIYGNSDVGAASVFFLNYAEVPIGKALYLGPNEPHAYLEGRILECMAASDNVVRAGLTSKFCDLETLLAMLHYRYGLPRILEPVAVRPGIEMYPSSAPDFSVSRLHLQPDRSLWLPDLDIPSIFIVLQGRLWLEKNMNRSSRINGQKRLFSKGSVFFLPGDLGLRGVDLEVHGDRDSVVFRAGVSRQYL